MQLYICNRTAEFVCEYANTSLNTVGICVHVIVFSLVFEQRS